MRSHRGITERTVDRYSPVILTLLRALGEEVECYDSKNLRDFVLSLAKRYSNTSTRHVTSPVRMFLRFLIATKRCRVGLEACIPTVPEHRRLPNYLSVDAIERIIAACPKTTQVGARDRAIVLLLARLGLRASDVAELKFRDVDWKQGTITLLGKNRREARLPLPSDVGNASFATSPVGAQRSTTRGSFSPQELRLLRSGGLASAPPRSGQSSARVSILHRMALIFFGTLRRSQCFERERLSRKSV